MSNGLDPDTPLLTARMLASGEGWTLSETSLGFLPSAEETYATKWMASGGRKSDTKLAQSCDTVGQEAFAAGLVDRRSRAVGDGDA